MDSFRKRLRDFREKHISYQTLYVDEPFEALQVKYRRKKVLEFLNRAPHQTILEVGCGLEPLYRYCDGYEFKLPTTRLYKGV